MGISGCSGIRTLAPMTNTPGIISSKYKVRISVEIGFYVRSVVVYRVRVRVVVHGSVVFGPGFKLRSRLVREIHSGALTEHNVELT